MFPGGLKSACRLAGMMLAGGVVVAARAQDGLVPPVSGPAVTMTPDGITVHADQMPLEQLLVAIGNRAGIAIVADVRLDEPVSIAMENERVVTALERILRRRSYVLAYSRPWDGAIADSPNRLWILSGAGSGRRLLNGDVGDTATAPDPVAEPDVLALLDEIVLAAPRDESGVVAELSAIVFGADEASLREEAVYALGDIGGAQSLSALHRALGDASATVRAAVATTLGGSGDARAEEGLLQALNDAEPGVREAAVYALAELGGGGAIVSVRRALADSDEGVREAAADVLDHWN